MVRDFVGNLLGIQGFSDVGGGFNWYLTGIIICYLLTPYLAGFIEKNKINKIVILIIFLLLVSTVFWNDERMIISIVRLPIYTLGMIFAKYDKKALTKGLVLCEIIGFVFGSVILYLAFKYASVYLWNYGLYWYPFILMTPFICHMISLISVLLCKNRIGNKIINLLFVIGDYSFEIYLVHIFVFEYLMVWCSNTIIEYNNFLWLSAFAFIIPCVMLLRFASVFF